MKVNKINTWKSKINYSQLTQIKKKKSIFTFILDNNDRTKKISYNLKFLNRM